jgi:hypothetical protein
MARGDGELELTVGVRGAGGRGGAAPAADAPASISLGRLILAGMVAGGVQYGWALQLSLLTPYVQVYIDARSSFLLPSPVDEPPSRPFALRDPLERAWRPNVHGARACVRACMLRDYCKIYVPVRRARTRTIVAASNGCDRASGRARAG